MKKRRAVDECKYPDSGRCRWCEYSSYPELFDGGCLLYYKQDQSYQPRPKTCEICGKEFTQTTPYDRACSPECGKKIRAIVKEEYLEKHPEKRKHYRDT